MVTHDQDANGIANYSEKKMIRETVEIDPAKIVRAN